MKQTDGDDLKKLNREMALRAHDLNRQTSAAFMQAALESANGAMKSLLLINGGAVVALLALLGSLIANDDSNAAVADALLKPLCFFASGVGFASLTAVLAYLVNLLDSDIENSVELLWEHPYVRRDGKAARKQKARDYIHWSAIGSAAVSLLSFAVGVTLVALNLGNL